MVWRTAIPARWRSLRDYGLRDEAILRGQVMRGLVGRCPQLSSIERSPLCRVVKTESRRTLGWWRKPVWKGGGLTGQVEMGLEGGRYDDALLVPGEVLGVSPPQQTCYRSTPRDISEVLISIQSLSNMEDSERLKALSDEFAALQNDLTSVIEARQKLDSQLQENQSVQKEFSTLDESANIYKLIGPVLVKQDKAEAVMNVDKRLEYIRSEIKRIEGQLKDLQTKQEEKKIEIIQLQSKMQQKPKGNLVY